MPPTRPKRGPPKISATAYTSSAILKSTSILTKPTTDLHAFLVTCLTSWSEYTEAQKQQVIASLPPTYQTSKTDVDGNLECPLSIDFTREDTYLREGIEKFKRDVGEGYFDPTWRKTAAIAMRDREEAEFGEVVPEQEQEEQQEASESDKDWGKSKVTGSGRRNGKIIHEGRQGERRSGRPRGAATRGELQSAMSMDD
jgi:hypothetical protein